MPETNFGVIHGRLQPPHLGHMEYLLEGKERCDHLIVGLTNPDPSTIEDHPADPDRSSDLANPFTYFERYQMVQRALVEYGIDRTKFEIVPFPINKPEILEYYTPKEATYFVTIYDEWGEAKKELLEEFEGEVEVMWRRDMSERLTSGTEVREFMINGNAWQALVPRSVAEYISENDLTKRVKKMGDNDGK